jgi:putative transport protein
MIESILSHPLANLFLIIALGSAIGKIKVANISLGASGILFVGLLFGHFGMDIPKEVQELGIVLFVYAIGLQGGSRFFNQFKKRGVVFAKIGVGVIVIGAFFTWLITVLFKINPALALGMYAGAMTSTPGLAAAMDAAGDTSVVVGFGIAYPLGVIGVVLLVQIVPRILRIDIRKEEERLRTTEKKSLRLRKRQFKVTNPGCAGKTLAQLQIHQITEVNVTRIGRDNRVLPAHRDFELQLNDIVAAVGREEELNKLSVFLGEETHYDYLVETTDVIARDVAVSSDEFAGKSLLELQITQRYGVVISRVFREDLNFVPTGNYVMEVGDVIRVTGARPECEKFVRLAGQQEKRIHETSILALAAGLFLGLLLAYKQFNLPGGTSFKFGLAGGPLLVSLILSHFGRIGPFNIRTPKGAQYILQQLGLALCLAGLGSEAGGSIFKILAESGPTILVAGAVVTFVSAASGLILAHFVFKQDILTTLGSISGAMTSTPALGAITDMSDRSECVLAYTGVYPVALILMAVVCQFLLYLL